VTSDPEIDPKYPLKDALFGWPAGESKKLLDILKDQPPPVADRFTGEFDVGFKNFLDNL
jgi:hypothetical protein